MSDRSATHWSDQMFSDDHDTPIDLDAFFDAPTEPDVATLEDALSDRLEQMKFVRLDDGAWWDD